MRKKLCSALFLPCFFMLCSCVSQPDAGEKRPFVYITNGTRFFLLPPEKIEKPIDMAQFISASYGEQNFYVNAWVRADFTGMEITLINELGSAMGELSYSGGDVRFSNGHKACSCKERCDCDRRYSDPEAKWGWDSYHERYFYGYTMYALSTHIAELKLDLPIYLRFVDANQFDGVSLIEAFAHARSLYKGFLRFDALLVDTAHDNYATYDLLRHFKVRPFIDLKSNVVNLA